MVLIILLLCKTCNCQSIPASGDTKFSYTKFFKNSLLCFTASFSRPSVRNFSYTKNTVPSCQGAYNYGITGFPGMVSSQLEVVIHSLINSSISRLLTLPSQFFIFQCLYQKSAAIPCPPRFVPLRLLIAAMPELFVYEKFGPVSAVTRCCRYRGGVPVLHCNRRN